MHAPEKAISPSDIKKLLSPSMISTLNDVEKIMGNLREMAATCNIDNIQHVHVFERNTIKFLLTNHSAQTLESEACKCVDNITQQTGKQITNQYEAFRLEKANEVAAGSSSAAGDSMVMRQYDGDGKLANAQALLQEFGFHVGSHVIRKDKVQGQIVGFEGPSGVLLELENKKVRVDASSFLSKEWTKYQPRAAPEFFDTWRHHNCFDFKDSQVAFMKAKILLEVRLQMSQSTCQKNPQWLLLRSKPKGVVAAEKIGKGALKLIPYTNRIDHKATEDQGSTSIYVTSADSVHYFLAPHTTLPTKQKDSMIVLFWFVQCTHSEDEANCEVFHPKPGANSEFRVPYIKNRKLIQKGDELLIYKPKAAAPSEQFQDMIPVPQKRMRTKETL